MTPPPPEPSPISPAARIETADRIFKDGDYPAALDLYQEALADNPEAPVFLLIKGALLARREEPEAAIAYCDKHLEFFPRDAEGWKLKSRLCAAAGRNQEALAAAERAAQIVPEDIDLLLFQGYLLADSFQEYPRAIRCYEAALRIRPRDAAVWSKKGRALYNLDRFKEAIACYNKALRLNKRDAEFWKDKGDCLNCLARGEKALACYKKALRLAPRRAAFWHIAALTYDDLGNRKKSLLCYRRVIEFADPEDRELVTEAEIALATEDS